MKFWIYQKKIKRVNQKLNYLFYLMLNNKILCRLGYIISYNNMYIIRINFNKIFYYLYLYRGFFEIRNVIYEKFFFLYYYYLEFCVQQTNLKKQKLNKKNDI